MEPHRRRASLGIILLLAGAGCEMGQAAAPTTETAAAAQSQLGIFDPAQLPDPCGLISFETIGTLIAAPATPVEGEPVVIDDSPLLFRTCEWGDVDARTGAVGIQISVPDLSGRDVVLNRTAAMEPAMKSSIGEDGKGTMNVGVMPTGGAKGATVFFRHNGYSIMIGHVGEGSSTTSVETVAAEVIAALDAG